MRVPPAQSSTEDEQLASASSGSRARSARVTLVSRVPNRNTETRLRASVMACRKCRNRRVYSLIEPEISSSATIGAGLSIRPSFRMSMISPPVRRELAQGAAHVEPQALGVGLVAAGAQFGLRQLHIGDGAGDLGDLGRAHLRKILFLQDLLVGDRQPQFLLLDLRRLIAHRRAAPSASCTRREAGGGFFLAWSGSGTEIQHVLPVFGGAEEQVEGLGEDQHMLVAA